MPHPRTSFIGRERELTALRSTLEGHHLVTVVGAGGAGKTRLVLELMRRDELEVVFCDLSEASSVDAMVLALANALGLAHVDDETLTSALAEDDAAVVVLDNLEQLLPMVAGTLERWLQRAPTTRFVVTSRAPTHLSDEHLIEVPPLGLPSPATIRDAEASALFVDRARALVPNLAPSEEQWLAIAEIVTRLDGLPLAIELAASRTRVLSVQQIAGQLSEKLDVMASRSPQRPARHATLRGVVAWSWNLLSEDEQAALRQLSVFRGSFDLRATGALIGQDDALETLQSLRDQALIRVELGTGVARYRLFECVRDYAAERLAESAEQAAAQERHDAYFASLADSGDQEKIKLCIDDLVEVQQRALQRDAVRALRIAISLEPLLLGRGPATLLLRLLDETLAAAPEDEPLTGAAHLVRGHALADAGRFEASLAARERSLEIARLTHDRTLEGKALASLGRHAWHGGRFDEAMTRSGEAIAVFEALGDESRVAETRSHRANFLWLQGHVDEARRDYLDALVVLERHDDRRAEAIALGNLASLERDMGFIPDAHEHFERSLALLSALGDRFHRGTFMMNLGGLLLENGDTADARAAFEEALTLHRQTGNRRWEGVALASLAHCDEIQGHLETATSGYATATELADRFGHPVMQAMILCWRARLAAERADLELASACLERAESVFREVGTTVVDGLAEVARAHIELARSRSAGEHIGKARDLIAALHEAGATRRSGDLRMAVGQLEACLDAAEQARRSELPAADQQTLVVAGTALGFRAPGGSWQDLSTRGALRRILAALSDRREQAPGQPLTRAQLVEAGWPDERITTDAAATRVYTAIATLRRRGLRGVLVRRDEGYLLDPSTPFRRR
jgi:predicted ATPase